MNKVILFLFLLLISTNVAFSVIGDNQFKIGFVLGYNKASISNSMVDYDKSINKTISGIEIEKHVFKSINLVSGIRLVNSGGKTKKWNQGFVRFQDEIPFFEYGKAWLESVQSYVEIPLHLKFNFSNNRIYIVSGPNIGILLSGKEKYFSELNNKKTSHSFSKDSFNKNNFAFDLGAGLCYKIHSKWSINIKGYYSFGLTDQYKKPLKRIYSINNEIISTEIVNISQKMRDMRFMLSFMYSL